MDNDPRPPLRTGPAARRLARATYAVGWAATGGPLTDRVKAGSRVAVALVAEHPDDPAVWEATLQLGALEGVWARIYARRDVLYSQHDRLVGQAWHDYTRRAVDRAALAATARRAAGLVETTAAEQDQRDRVIAAVLAVLLALLATQTDPDTEQQRATLVSAIHAALAAGAAEGTAGAVAVAAQRAGYNTVDFDAAYRDAFAAANDPAHAAYYQAQALVWLRRMVTDTATDLGGRLARQVERGDSADDMAATVDQYCTSATNPTVRTHTDWLVGTGFAVGAFTAFTALGLATVNWVTAGDGKVCRTCQSNEDRNPWPLISVPQLPAHPRCRCATEPAGPVDSLKAFAQYVIGG